MSGSGPEDPGAVPLGRTVLSGGLWVVGGRTLPLVYTLVISVVAARVLGPALMGQLALITFAAASILALLVFAPAGAMTRTIGEALGRGEADAVRSLVGWAWKVAFALAALALAIFGSLSLVVDSHALAWALAGVWTATTALHAVPSVLLSGAQRWREAIVVGLTTGLVHVAAALAVLAAGGGITELIAVDAAVGAVNVVGTVWLARRVLATYPAPSASTTDLRPAVTRYALGTAPAVALAYVIERRSELFFLGVFATTTQVALYSIPFSALSVLALVPTAIGAVTSTAMATLLGGGSVDRIRNAHERGVRLTLLLALPVTAAGLALGPSTLRLVYGDDYADTGRVFLILIAALPLIVVTALEIAVLQGLGRIREQVVVYGVAAAANVVLALTLIPEFDATGAATAHSAAYVVAVAAAVVATRRRLGGVDRRLVLLVPTLAASVVGGAIAAALDGVLEGGPGALAAFAGGAVAFAVLARFLRVVPRDDALWLAGHTAPRVGRAVLAFAPPAAAGAPA
jgi:O-antigen/teichoic acid export membrane protein